MQYFEEYPKIVYDLVGRGDYKVVTDLLRRVKVRDGVKNNVSLFDKYNVKDGETPEQVSNKFYNSEEYQEAKSFRDGKADFNAIVIEGLNTE